MAGAGIIGHHQVAVRPRQKLLLGFKQITQKHSSADDVPRTDRDLKMSTVLIGLVVSVLAIGGFFYILISQATRPPPTKPRRSP